MVIVRLAAKATYFLALILTVGFLLTGGAAAVEPGEILKDPSLEARARTLSLELRCLVCQNQSIDDSDAPLARDLRVIVRERLQAGDSDQEVLDFVVARYGEFVLLRPPFKTYTLLLWLAPVLALMMGLWLAFRAFQGGQARVERSGGGAAKMLTPEEEAKLRQMFDEPDGR